VLFPLWVKLGLLFGGLIGSFIGLYGMLTVHSERAREAERLRQEMEAVASALSAGIDGDVFRSFQRESDRERPTFQAVVRQLHSVVQTADSVTWAGACRRDDAGRWHWVVEHTNENAYPVGYPIFDGEAERNRAYDEGVVYAPELEDETGVWRTMFARIDDSNGQPVGLVEVIADADRDSLVAATSTRRIVALVLLSIAVSIGLSFLVGRVLSGNLAMLAAAARRVSQGDYEARVDLRTADELGVLAHAFNEMMEGLAEREFIRDTFGRFVHPEVVSDILAERDLSLGGEAREVTVLMSDLRGFTALSQQLGPVRTVALLNRYLSQMTQLVDDHGGNVSELLGDGMVVLFGAPVAHDDDPQRAARCAVAMLSALDSLNEETGHDLQMGIGIDTGMVVAGNIGSEHHMKYGVVGDTINLAARLEDYTVGTQALVSAATAAQLRDTRLGQSTSFQPKGRSEPMVCHVLLEVEGARPPAQFDPLYSCTIEARARRVRGSQVDDTRHRVPVTAVGERSLELVDLEVDPRDKLALDLILPDGEVTDLYATVARITPDGRVRLRFTSLPPAARAAIERLIREAGSPRPITSEGP